MRKWSTDPSVIAFDDLRLPPGFDPPPAEEFEAIIYETGRKGPYVIIESRESPAGDPTHLHIGRGLTMRDIVAHDAHARRANGGHYSLEEEPLYQEYFQDGRRVAIWCNHAKSLRFMAGEEVVWFLDRDDTGAECWRVANLGRSPRIRVTLDTAGLKAFQIKSLTSAGFTGEGGSIEIPAGPGAPKGEQ